MPERERRVLPTKVKMSWKRSFELSSCPTSGFSWSTDLFKWVGATSAKQTRRCTFWSSFSDTRSFKVILFSLFKKLRTLCWAGKTLIEVKPIYLFFVKFSKNNYLLSGGFNKYLMRRFQIWLFYGYLYH